MGLHMPGLRTFSLQCYLPTWSMILQLNSTGTVPTGQRISGCRFYTVKTHHKYGFYYTPSQVRTGTNLPGAAWWSLFPGPGGYNTDHPLPPQRSRAFPIRTQIYSWASSCDLPASTTCTTPGLQPWGPATQPADSAPWLCVSTDITPFPSSRCSIYLLLFLLSNKVCGFLAVIVLFQ